VKDEELFKFRQSDVIWPAIGADDCRMAASAIRAIGGGDFGLILSLSSMHSRNFSSTILNATSVQTVTSGADKEALAEPEGFEPSIGLYNPITV
jgi:hypothetical protein